MKKKNIKLEKTFKELTTARFQANELRKRIEGLRNSIREAGGNPDPPRIDVIPRNKEMFKMWKDGHHPKDIGKDYRLSPERVRQICMRIEAILERKGHCYEEYKDLLPYRD